LLPINLEGDWTFVTKNSIDFCGPADVPGSKEEYRKANAGLICLNGPVGMDLDMQNSIPRRSSQKDPRIAGPGGEGYNAVLGGNLPWAMILWKI
jgi:hypothetical protein